MTSSLAQCTFPLKKSTNSIFYFPPLPFSPMRQFFDVFEKPNIAYAFLSQTRSNQSESITRTDLCDIQSESSLNLITPSVHIMQNSSSEIIFVCIIQIDYFPTEKFFFQIFYTNFVDHICIDYVCIKILFIFLYMFKLCQFLRSSIFWQLGIGGHFWSVKKLTVGA